MSKGYLCHKAAIFQTKERKKEKKKRKKKEDWERCMSPGPAPGSS